MTKPSQPPIKVSAGADGSLIYLVDQSPEALPQVRVRDLAQAWENAREAAQAEAWSVPRGLRFARGDGAFTDLALADPDASCWAGAVDRMVGLHTCYGMSLCLRLLALVDLLARASWTSRLLALRPDGARLHPALLSLAATATLTAEACFDEKRFEDGLGHLAVQLVSMTGACT